PCRPRKPDDRRGGRRAGPRGRQGGRVRRQGDQRHRRDPVPIEAAMKPRIAITLLPILILTGCAGSSSPPSTSGPSGPAPGASSGATTLTIYGAASLKAALAALKTAYEADHPGTSLTIS